MERLKRKQEDYKEKIQRIQQTFTNIKGLDQSGDAPLTNHELMHEDDMRPTRLKASQSEEDSSALLLYSQDGVSVLMS